MTTDLPKLQGQLLAKGSSEFEEARCRNFALNSHNKTKEDNHPSYIAVCETVDDVQACVKFAQAQKMTITVRSGGHNWFGCFLRKDVFLIDMQKFAKIDLDASSSVANVGPAVVGSDLNEAAAKHGLCFPSGHCEGVPLGGFLLGGGLGWFMSYYGLAAEHLEEVTLVTPQGNVVTAQEGDDWLWMARGSASAFPGVVVEYKIRLSPLPKVVRFKTDFFPVEAYDKIVSFLNEYLASNPEDSKKLELVVNLACTPPPLAEVAKVPKLVMVMQTWLADSQEDFQKQVAPLSLDKFPVSPLVPGEFQDYSFSGLSAMMGPAFPPGQHWVCRALGYHSKTFNDVEWGDVQQTFVDKAPMGLSHCMLAFSPLRAVSKPGSYGRHSAHGFFTLVVGVHGPGESSTPATEYVDSMMGILDRHVDKYDPLQHPLNKDTFAKSFEEPEKILEIRSKLDPEKLFFDPSTAAPSH